MRLMRMVTMLIALLSGGVALAQAPAAVPSPAATTPDPENVWVLDLSSGGRVTIDLFATLAPNHVERIKTLTRRGFYNGLKFHRVIDGFMAQGGDPKGDGTGGSDLPDLKAEFSPWPHVRGTLSMARADSPDSANSQFFIMLLPRFSLDNKYTALGRVSSGMQFVDALAQGEPPENPDFIVQASILSDNKPAPDFAAVARSRAAAAAQVAPARPTISAADLAAPLK